MTAVVLRAENWPQWRGPLLNGVSGEKNLPVRWSTTENVTWKLALPAWSGSTPIVWGDRIFLNVAEDLKVRDGDNLSLWCVDRVRGTVLWKRPLGGGNHIPKDYGRFGLNWGYGSSPLLHGDALYVQVLHGMRTDDPSYLLRIDTATGKTVWRVERPTRARMESPDAYTPRPRCCATARRRRSS